MLTSFSGHATEMRVTSAAASVPVGPVRALIKAQAARYRTGLRYYRTGLDMVKTEIGKTGAETGG